MSTMMRTAMALSAAVMLASAAPGAALAQANVGAVLNELGAQCNVLIYEDDCLSAVRKAVAAAKTAPAADQTRINAAIAEVLTKNAPLAPRIKELVDAGR